MPKKYKNMSEEEKNRYWEGYFGTRDTLRFAIIDLIMAADEAKFSSVSSAILAEKLRLESELARLQNHSTAVAAGNESITPPSPDDVKYVKGLAEYADKLTLNAKTYQKAIELADKALNTYAKVKA